MNDLIATVTGNVPWLPALIWVVAVIVILTIVGRWIKMTWPFLVRFVSTINALATLPAFIVEQREFRHRTDDTLAKQDKQIAQIHHEVNFNNGSSVKDAVIRVEQNVSGIYSHLGVTEEDVEDTINHRVSQFAPRPPRVPR